jgi:hypothetical protein
MESDKKEFVSNKEREEYFEHLENKKKEASKAKKELFKISQKIGHEETALKKIFEKVVNTQKIEPEHIEIANDKDNVVYRVDKLSKLSKDHRKLISKVFEIINDVLDKKIAESLIQKIEEELK